MDELLLEKILASCRRLEKFSLKYSMPLRNIKVTGLMALTNVELSCENHTSVEIDGPSLLCLKIERCANLKSLLISSNSLISKTKAGFTIPNLQNLKLHCTKRFAISTDALPRMKAELHLRLDRFGPTTYFDLLNLLIELNRSESLTLLINLPNKVIPEKWKTRFAGKEHLSQFQSIWLGTNIGLMDGLRMSFPNHRILHDSVWNAYVREEDDWGY